jgi:sterol desaturase/sphingolipid hydroxylase (fatty acid hydroxylase superfamily)
MMNPGEYFRPSLIHNYLQENYQKVIFYLTAFNAGCFTFMMHYSGLEGCLMSMTIAGLSISIDLAYGKAFKNNLKTASVNGYSNDQVIALATLNYFLVFPGSLLAISMAFPKLVVPYFSFGWVLKVAILLGFSELAFTTLHCYLHTAMHKFHTLHHCCKTPSYTSNFIFHPFDLSLEFGAPNIAIIAINSLTFQDEWAALTAMAVSVLFYTLDHDEYFNSPHLRHHSGLTSPYNAYLDVRMTLNDKLRSTIKTANE